MRTSIAAAILIVWRRRREPVIEDIEQDDAEKGLEPARVQGDTAQD